MAKNEKRVQVTLACEQCKRRNYITMKNKLNDRERIEMKKYCRWDRSTPCTRRPADPSGLLIRACGPDRPPPRASRGSSLSPGVAWDPREGRC